MEARSSVNRTSPVPGISALEVLGYGGFSVVYRARQESVGREVALKVDNRTVRDERDRRRFLREAHAAGRLSDHPNVISVFDAGITHDGRPYLVMELCPNGSLADRVKRDGTLPAAEVREIGVRIADALDTAHAAGVLHRDLKPANILINRFGAPGLTDFGLAAMPDPSRQLSATLEALTPAYAPPEVFRLEHPTAAVDIYSLGATLYSLLSGRPPRWPAHGHPSLPTILDLHREPIPDLPGVPRALVAVLRQAMDSDPARRYPSAAVFRDAMRGVALDAPTELFSAPRADPPRTATLRTQPVHASRAATAVLPVRGSATVSPPSVSPPVRRRRWPIVLAAVGVVLAVLIGGTAAAMSLREDNPTDTDNGAATGTSGSVTPTPSVVKQGTGSRATPSVTGGSPAAVAPGPTGKTSPKPSDKPSASPTPTPSDAPEFDQTLRAGGLGPLTVGAAVSELLDSGQARPATSETCDAAQQIESTDTRFGGAAAHHDGSVIQYVIITDGGHSTQSGLHVGSTVDDIPEAREYKTESSLAYLVDGDAGNGLLFVIDTATNTVKTIVVGEMASLEEIAGRGPSGIC